MEQTSPAPAGPMVARVLPLLGLPHLDRAFDYRIPGDLDEAARPGVRVRIRFAGRLVDGILLERAAATEHPGDLQPLKAVISPEVVYPPRLARLVDSLAEYLGGVRSDLIRAAVPGRHARVERGRTGEPPSWEELGPLAGEAPDLGAWSRYAWGESFVDATLAGAPARAAWQAAPGEDRAARVAELAVAVARAGGGALIIVPDARRVARVEAALRELVAARQITVLTAEVGPEARYRRYLDILHGSARLVVGTRSAAFAPLPGLRLAVLLDDGDDNLVDPRAPYAHAREVLVTRSSQEGCALLLGGWARTAEVADLVRRGWAGSLVPETAALAAAAPALSATADSAVDPDAAPRGRLPAAAYRAATAALRAGAPVLVQVPRRGYQPALACGRCGTPARCPACNGPLGIPAPGPEGAAQPPACRWCGHPVARHRCRECGSPRLRATITGSERTAEELGRVFAPHPVRSSAGERILRRVDDGPRVVVATPGAEPVAEGGYGAVLLLDTWAMLGRQDLRAAEDALAHWLAAAALARPAAAGGAVVVDADAAIPAVAALLRWDPAGAAAAELADRAVAGFPPATRMAAVDGTAEAVRRFLGQLALPAGAEVLGPVDFPPGPRPPAGLTAAETRRALLRVPREHARELGRALRAAAASRALVREERPVRVIVDPARIG
ncbi:primosome assembly protein PriA [Corynebacterium sphenisci DSM 44792]|uniref:Probable replication restart protein PriA n=1 Tax=Corynebacterium sphenisci DSM 44792 TaxID=1437874 RepID=A0A1L7CY22_9CORY|nr:primosome assembly protein PriA [Corynebacterium sphenisci]APT90717.1 primosome assembly protein PriA [Corynebacterium sphenisci DSM 44792]